MGSKGKVFIVGAGPGDPSLLTLKAVGCLTSADVVLYDRLVGPGILDFAPACAEKIYVGKESGVEALRSQDRINQLMLSFANAGKNVVRLKGGDPFVFGRGSEEMVALANCGIEVEIVPGISSCIAVPAAAKIPLTHRNLSSAFAVFTAHSINGCEINWTLAAAIPTAVFLMGAKQLQNIVDNLIKFGRNRETPVALIENGTLANQRIVVGTLSSILENAGIITPPAIFMVGDVVKIRDQVIESTKDKNNSLFKRKAA